MLKPWCWLPPQLAHDLAPYGLKLAASLWGKPQPPRWRSVSWRGLEFPNPVGVAGGVDKTAASLISWWQLGAGFVEVGTVTPRPQRANPGVVLARDPKGQFLWNRMGFPSPGADAVLRRLESLRRPYPAPLFINVGKNRNSDLNSAPQDYIHCLRKFADTADAFVLNISSPNTEGLRNLQAREYFANFLGEILSQARPTKPVLIKISPDVSDDELQSLLATAVQMGVAGFVLTNTTIARPPIDTFPAQGGFSGVMVKSRSTQLLERTVQILGADRQDKLIVSVGGVETTHDVCSRLALGADLIQVYTALVFEGPRFFLKMSKDMAQIDRTFDKTYGREVK